MTTRRIAPGEITSILADLQRGDVNTPKAENRPLELVFDELRRPAPGFMRVERVDQTLQPSALVNEAYMPLVKSDGAHWGNSARFLGMAARAMRRVLIEHVCRCGRLKRSGGGLRVTLGEGLELAETPDVQILDLERALTRLSKMDAPMGQVAEMWFARELLDKGVK